MKERDQNGWLLCLNSEMRYHCKMGGVGDFFCQAVWMEGRWVCEVFILHLKCIKKTYIYLLSPLLPCYPTYLLIATLCVWDVRNFYLVYGLDVTYGDGGG